MDLYEDNSKTDPSNPFIFREVINFKVDSIVESGSSNKGEKYYYTSGNQIYRLDIKFDKSVPIDTRKVYNYLFNYDKNNVDYRVYTTDNRILEWKPEMFGRLPEIVQFSPIGKAYNIDGSLATITTLNSSEDTLRLQIDTNISKIKGVFNYSMYMVNNSAALINLSSAALKDKQNYSLYTGQVLERTIKNKELTTDSLDYSYSGMAISKTIYSVSNYSFPTISSLLYGYNGEGCFTGINSTLPNFYPTTWFKTSGEKNTYFIRNIAGIKEYWDLGLFGTIKVSGKEKKIYPEYNLIAICLYKDPETESIGFKPMFGKSLPTAGETLIQGCNSTSINDLLIGNEDVTHTSLYYITEDHPIQTWYIYDLKKVVVLSDIIANNNSDYRKILKDVNTNLDKICTQPSTSTAYKSAVAAFVELQDQNIVPILF
jgi:hypothetical protein